MTQISPMGVEKDNVTSFEVRVSIDNPGKELKANMTANAEIVLEEHPDSLIVPEAAITYDAQKHAFVDVLAPGSKTGRKKIAGEGRGRQRHEDPDPRRPQGRATRSSSPRSVVEAFTGQRTSASGLKAHYADESAMKEAIVQSIQNLRANKLRSLLTMFGILWGMISVVVLSATGEGFRRGNDKVLRELGKNIGIVWGGRTSMQAGGERAGREIRLTLDDARAIAAESSMIAVVSPEIERGAVKVKSAYNAATRAHHGHRAAVSGHPHHRAAVRAAASRGRTKSRSSRVAIVGADMAEQLFGKRNILNEPITLNGMPYTVVGKIRKKNQDSNYSGPDNNKIFVPFAAMSAGSAAHATPRPARCRTSSSRQRTGWSTSCRARSIERTGRIEDIDWPLEQNIRAILARRHGFDPADRQAIAVWDTSLQTLMFGRMIGHMKQFFSIVGIVTLALGGIGVMNIMLVAVKERTREIGVRKALGATTAVIQRQFFLEGFFLTLLSGGAGMLMALALCQLVNLAPMPDRFSGMVLSWQSGVMALVTLLVIGVVTSTYPARRAAELPPVEALRFEM